jgi:predicted ABC-type ATPase
MLAAKETEYFNPDDATRRILSQEPGLSLAEANSKAWFEGMRLLQRAIDERGNYAFETTLGGRTVTAKLREAIRAGVEVRIWYAGLNSPDLHISRVRSRVTRGGHDIPESKIRERYTKSLLNLIGLLPVLTELVVYDNSDEADPETGNEPLPKLVLHLRQKEIVASCDLATAPEWAKPILAAALRVSNRP